MSSCGKCNREIPPRKGCIRVGDEVFHGRCLYPQTSDIVAMEDELATLRAQLADAMARQLTPEGRLPPALADLVEELEQENLALEKRLADAQRVIDTARPVRKADGYKIMERVRAFEQALRDYDAKYGK